MTSEKRILNEALIAVSALPGVMAWRNNTGQGWVLAGGGRLLRPPIGSMVRVTPGMVILTEARPINFGLPGSADILGVIEARAFGVETKTLTGRQSDQQRKFQAAFERAGGLYGVARSPEEAVMLLRGGGILGRCG